MLNRLVPHCKLFLPHIFLLGLIFLCLTLREAPPRALVITQTISANDSFSVTFSKPLNTDDLEKKLTVWRDGEPINGAIKKTATTLIFSPEKPWESGQDYQVRIESLPAERGGTSTKPIVQKLHIRPEKFLYQSLDSRLMEGDPETGTTKVVTPDTIDILSFSVGTGGHFVALYEPKGDQHKNGILLGRKDGEQYEIKLMPVVESPKYSQVYLCNGSQTLVLLAQGNTGDPHIEYFVLDWDHLANQSASETWNLKDIAVYNETDFACSGDTPRVLYRKASGAFVTNFLGEDSEDLVGVYDGAIGFSPKDRLMALQKSITETGKDVAYHSELSLTQSDGTSTTLSAPNTMFREASFNGNSTLLSLLYLDGEAYTSRVETYGPNADTWVKTKTVLPPTDKRITHQALSLDGRSLVIELEPGAMVNRMPTDATKIILWSLVEDKQLPFVWAGKYPTWEK